MKYIVIQLGEQESIFVFPRHIDHDRMFEACEAIRFGSDRNWERKIKMNGDAIAAGFIDGGKCHGRSETLGLNSRGDVDTALLASTFATAPPARVVVAVNRMCTPLDQSVLTGATAEADAHSMQVIRDYVFGSSNRGA